MQKNSEESAHHPLWINNLNSHDDVHLISDSIKIFENDYDPENFGEHEEKEQRFGSSVLYITKRLFSQQ